MSGTRALITVAIIGGIIGLKVWSGVHGRDFAHGTWTITPDHAMYYQFTSSKSSKVKAEFEPDAGSPADYNVYMVDEAAKIRLATHTTDPDAVQKLYSTKAHGAITVDPIPVDSGSYYFIIDNPGKDTINIKYKLYEISN